MKRYICMMIMFVIVLTMPLCVYGQYDSTVNRVVDNADLLTDNEEELLKISINEIIGIYNFDIVIVTTDSCEGKSVADYADDFYDYNNYGYGDEYDGILFLLSMEERDWYFSTCGYGITAFTDYGIDYIGNAILSDLSGGHYYDAFASFINYTESFLIEARSNIPYDTNNLYYDAEEEIIRGVTPFIIAFIVSVIISLIIVSIMKSSMNSIRPQHQAHDYIVKDSLLMKKQSDVFMYSNVSKSARESSNSSSGGGSSTHTSSSGRTHGGGGGKF